MNDYYAVIMAGGGGTRLWPLSRRDHPKQMLTIFGKQSLYQMAVSRLHGLLDEQNIRVVTTREQYHQLQPSTPQLKQYQFLLEPEPRGTAAVIGLAAMVLSRSKPDAVMAVLTADHVIQNVALFQRALRQAYQLAKAGELVTLGMIPTHPATGYGYIELGDVLPGATDLTANRVRRFVEKPDQETAVKYLEQKTYLWNGGMFFWRVDVILAEFARQMPELYALLQEINKIWGTPAQDEKLPQLWAQIKPQTIDYGIMEHASHVAVIPLADLGWNDVGSWDSLAEVIDADDRGNIMLAEKNSSIDSQGCIIYEENSQKLITMLGVKDLVIIDTPDALLVCPRSEAQRIRDVVSDVKRRHQDRYL